jgi:hypothetical protein
MALGSRGMPREPERGGDVMGGLGLLIPVLLLVGVFVWFRRYREPTPGVEQPSGRIPLLTEAVGYVGAVLLIAGAGTAIGQGWDDLADGMRLGLLAGTAGLLLGAGLVTRRSAEPALVRLTSLVWVLGTAAVAGALTELFVGFVETPDETTFLVVAAATTALAALLYAVHPTALQQLALFAGVLVTSIAIGVRIDPHYPAWVGGVTAWAVGFAWSILGATNRLTPSWVAMPVGLITALIAPTAIQDAGFGAMFAVGIATAAGMMAGSVRWRSVPGLALGTFGLFAYVTGAVVHYFGDTMGVPAALAVSGTVILLLAVVTTRLARFTRNPPRTEHGKRPPTLRPAS